jgi:hypothetical protein
LKTEVRANRDLSQRRVSTRFRLQAASILNDQLVEIKVAAYGFAQKVRAVGAQCL